MTTATSGLFTNTETATAVRPHPVVALTSFLFATELRQSITSESTVDQSDAAVTWGL
ncbi:MAG: hypothetical protein NVSMB6_04300 [Burkholderiaceae bacterium]